MNGRWPNALSCEECNHRSLRNMAVDVVGIERRSSSIVISIHGIFIHNVNLIQCL
jgi:hypothetical protein